MVFTPITAWPNFGVIKATPPIAVPATLADGATWSSDLMPANYGGVAIAATASRAGTLTLQRYADLAGLIPIGALFSQALSAATPAWTGGNDGLPYASFACSIINSAGGVMTISNVSILTGPQI